MSKLSRRTEDMLISSVLLLGVLITLALFLIFVSSWIYLIGCAWGKWGW